MLFVSNMWSQYRILWWTWNWQYSGTLNLYSDPGTFIVPIDCSLWTKMKLGLDESTRREPKGCYLSIRWLAYSTKNNYHLVVTPCSHYLLTWVQHSTVQNKLQCESIAPCWTGPSTAEVGWHRIVVQMSIMRCKISLSAASNCFQSCLGLRNRNWLYYLSDCT